MGGKSLLIIDTSDADDSCADGVCNSAPYAAQFANLNPKPGTWLLSHRPIWAIGQKFALNRTLQQALQSSDGRLPSGIEFVLSGHLHTFELLSFADQRPPQLVVGTGGTVLDETIKQRLVGMTIGGATVSYARTEHRFGFLMIAPQKDGSMTAFIGSHGEERFKCALTPLAARCD